MSTLRSSILSQFEEADGPLTPKEIFEHLDEGTYASVRGELVRMKHRGLLRQPAYGVYALADEAEAQWVDSLPCLEPGRAVRLATPLHRSRFEERSGVQVKDLRMVCHKMRVGGEFYDCVVVDAGDHAYWEGCQVVVERGHSHQVEYFPVEEGGEVLGRVVWVSRFL